MSLEHAEQRMLLICHMVLCGYQAKSMAGDLFSLGIRVDEHTMIL